MHERMRASSRSLLLLAAYQGKGQQLLTLGIWRCPTLRWDLNQGSYSFYWMQFENLPTLWDRIPNWTKEGGGSILRTFFFRIMEKIREGATLARSVRKEALNGSEMIVWTAALGRKTAKKALFLNPGSIF